MADQAANPAGISSFKLRQPDDNEQEQFGTQPGNSQWTVEGSEPSVFPPPVFKISDWKLLKYFLRYLAPHWKLLALGIGTVPFSVGATLLIPWLIIGIIDDYVMPGDWEGLYLMSGILGLTMLSGYLADSLYTFSLQKTGQLTISNLRTDLFSHVLRLPRSFFDQRPIGVVLTRVTTDMEALNDTLAVGVLNVITDLLKTAALLILLFSLSWRLTLVVLLIIPPVYLITSFLRRRLRFHYNLTRETLAEATGYLQECLNGVKTIQLYAAENKVEKRFKHKTRRFLHAQNHSNFYDATLFAVIEGVISVALGLMIWYGAGRILEGMVTLGILVGFINTLNRIFIPIREFTQQISVFQRGLSSLENIYRFFREMPEDFETGNNSKKLNYLPENSFSQFKELVFENVWFRYSEEAEWVLKGISFTLKKGNRIAIVGPTGSGKSTIVRILTRMYTDYQGSIRLNGIELSTIPRSHLNHMISLMQQDSFLFAESIGFNISLKRPGITHEQIKEAAKYVYADSFIERLPGKFEYILTQNGSNLSAGEGRLLVFARAIAGKSEMIVLDEATSAVDSVTESLIQRAIERIFRDKTVIAIAHRLSTIRHSDLILVVEEGKVIERGKHEALMQIEGVYAGLIRKLQSSESEADLR